MYELVDEVKNSLPANLAVPPNLRPLGLGLICYKGGGGNGRYSLRGSDVDPFVFFLIVDLDFSFRSDPAQLLPYPPPYLIPISIMFFISKEKIKGVILLLFGHIVIQTEI